MMVIFQYHQQKFLTAILTSLQNRMGGDSHSKLTNNYQIGQSRLAQKRIQQNKNAENKSIFNI